MKQEIERIEIKLLCTGKLTTQESISYLREIDRKSRRIRRKFATGKAYR